MKIIYFLLINCLISLPISAQMVINSGATVTVNGAATIRLLDAGFENNGTFNAGTGTVEMAGSTPASATAISGTGNTTFYNLTINKSSDDVQLNADINLSNTLTFTAGNLLLNGFDVTLGSTAALSGEAETRRAIGSTGGVLRTTRTLNAPSGLNPGNLGFTITSAANLGSTLIERGHEPQFIQFESGIQRYFNVFPTNNTGLNAQLTLAYFDAELNGLPEGNLQLFQNTSGAWTNFGKDAQNTTANTLSKNGLSSLALLTFAQSSALPLEWISFTVKPSKPFQAELTWVVEQETGVKAYDVEHATDGFHFEKISEVPALNAVSKHQNAYTFSHDAAQPGLNYYRIRQTDLDGHFSYSAVRSIQFSGKANLTLAPNPADKTLRLYYSGDDTEPTDIRLYDVCGRMIFQEQRMPGLSDISIPVGDYPDGVYWIQLTSAGRLIHAETLVIAHSK